MDTETNWREDTGQKRTNCSEFSETSPKNLMINKLQPKNVDCFKKCQKFAFHSDEDVESCSGSSETSKAMKQDIVSWQTNMSDSSEDVRIQGAEKDQQAKQFLIDPDDEIQYEHQELGEGPIELECNSAWSFCQKDPKHEHFIPVAQFTEDHLPQEARGENALREMSAMVALTVRVRIRYTSEARPDKYPMSDYRGKNVNSTGTGHVFNMEPNMYFLRNVEQAQQQHKQVHIDIRTATHVLFDSEEGEHAEVDFFYDDKDALKDGRVKTLKVLEIVYANIRDDTCIARCATDDWDLIGKIANHLIYHYNFEWKTKPSDLSTLVIVSHPHGMPKQITIGEMDYTNISIKMFRYNTPTCPGSSGALFISFTMLHDEVGTIFNVHKGSFCRGKFNASSRAFKYKDGYLILAGRKTDESREPRDRHTDV